MSTYASNREAAQELAREIELMSKDINQLLVGPGMVDADGYISGSDFQEALNDAKAFAQSRYNRTNKYVKYKIDIPTASVIKAPNPIIADPSWVEINGNSSILDAGTMTAGTFKGALTFNATAPNDSQHQYSQRKTLSGLQIWGPGDSVYGLDGLRYTGNPAFVNVDDVEIKGFDNGIKLSTYTFINTWRDMKIHECNTGFNGLDETWSGGEKMVFESSVIFNNNFGVKSNGGDILFSHTSIDYNRTSQFILKGAKVHLTDCHIEGRSIGSANYFLIDDADSQPNPNCGVYATNCNFLITSYDAPLYDYYFTVNGMATARFTNCFFNLAGGLKARVGGDSKRVYFSGSTGYDYQRQPDKVLTDNNYLPAYYGAGSNSNNTNGANITATNEPWFCPGATSFSGRLTGTNQKITFNSGNYELECINAVFSTAYLLVAAKPGDLLSVSWQQYGVGAASNLNWWAEWVQLAGYDENGLPIICKKTAGTIFDTGTTVAPNGSYNKITPYTPGMGTYAACPNWGTHVMLSCYTGGMSPGAKVWLDEIFVHPH